ncbi:MAG TPA: dienelactone hydrolase family protein, partial [Pseudolabrys sp.]|nr:dienelactone hydrolase family protein [Pseudolabrys sp.]
MDQRVIDLYDSFTHGGMSRRAFLDRLAEIAGSSAAALALLPLLQNDYARAAIVAPDDARLAIDMASYDAAGTRINGYLARLKDKAERPAVIVIHENRGLNPHIKDIARRLALAGYLAYAVDLLSPFGGTPADEDK